MYKITVNSKSVALPTKQEVMSSLSKALKAISDCNKEVCIILTLEHCELEVWRIDEDTLLLFYNPLDEREDCKISYSGKIEDMNSAPFELKDSGHGISGCNNYNLLSMEQAIKQIEGIVNNKQGMLSGNWYSW